MLAVARIELLHLLHDRTSISLILIVPAFQIVLFGYAVNPDSKHIPIAISEGLAKNGGTAPSDHRKNRVLFDRSG
jgi:hypothetical protein